MVFQKFLIKWEKLDRYAKATVFLIVVTILVRLLLTHFSYITGDACGYMNVIRYMAENYKIPLHESLGRPPFWQPPLVFVISAFFYKLFAFVSMAFAEFQVKLWSVAASALLLLFTFLVVRKTLGSRIAFYTVLFVAFIPDFIYYSTIPFVDIALGLFVVVSIYYALNDSFLVAGIFMGFALLTKYNALFAVPIPLFLLYRYFSNDKILLVKRAVRYVVAMGSVGLIWFVRNWILLGSPIWPHFTSAIETVETTGVPSFLNILNPFTYVRLYLSFFGVPDGYYQNLFFLPLPFLNLLILVWLIGTVIFIFPMFKGIMAISKKKKVSKFLLLWCAPFFLLFVLTLTGGSLSSTTELLSNDVPSTVLSRYLTPIYPVLGVLWAVGLFSAFKTTRYRRTYLLLFLVISLCFVGVELVKAIAVRNAWTIYDQDYDFIKLNTPRNSVILVPFGACNGYNFNRYTVAYHQNPELYNVVSLRALNVSYIWANQENRLYGFSPDEPAIYPAKFYTGIKEKHELIYQNNETKTEVYKVIS